MTRGGSSYSGILGILASIKNTNGNESSTLGRVLVTVGILIRDFLRAPGVRLRIPELLGRLVGAPEKLSYGLRAETLEGCHLPRDGI